MITLKQVVLNLGTLHLPREIKMDRCPVPNTDFLEQDLGTGMFSEVILEYCQD